MSPILRHPPSGGETVGGGRASQGWRDPRALGYALAGGVIAWLACRRAGLGATDLDQIWLAARALLQSQDPYALVRTGAFQFPYFYPGTTTVAALPLTPLGLGEMRAVYVVLTGALFGYAVGRFRPWAWPVFLSIPFIIGERNAQPAILVSSALLLPGVGLLAAIKPNLALAVLAGARSWRQVRYLVGGGIALTTLSLAADPDWPWRWIATVSGASHFSSHLVRPGGVLLLLGLLRWRDPDARLLVALGVVPGTGLFYDALPALLVTRTSTETLILSLLSQVAGLAADHLPPVATFEEASRQAGTLVVWSVLLPALGLVLVRGRPARGGRGSGAGSPESPAPGRP